MDTLEVFSAREAHKSRAFSTSLLGYVTAPSMWKLGYGDASTGRPALLMYTGTDQEVKAFTANVRTGRKLRVMGHRSHGYGLGTGEFEVKRLELPKSAGFKWAFQEVQKGVQVATAYLPELWVLERGMVDPAEIAFLCAPPTWWVEAQLEVVSQLIEPSEENGWGRDAVIAAYVCAFIDRRSTLPMVNDLGFHLALYRKAQDEGWLSSPGADGGPMDCYPNPIPGLEQVIACRVGHEEFEDCMRDLARAHYSKEIASGKTRIPSAGGVLPHAPAPAGQLGLFDQVS